MLDEYIRRKDAAKLLGNIFGVDVVRRLHEVPAVDVAPVVHAHRVDTGGMYGDCSNCRYTLPFGVKYCSECGAKIDGGAEK